MITVKAVCNSCDGTGLYSGFAEQKSVAVVCNGCKGTGCANISYKPFEKRKGRRDITTVFERNSGYSITEASRGGLSYKDWANGISLFGREQRDTACPHLHDQSFNLKNGNCDDVHAGQYIRECPHFKAKATCWQEWDKRKGK